MSKKKFYKTQERIVFIEDDWAAPHNIVFSHHFDAQNRFTASTSNKSGIHIKAHDSEDRRGETKYINTRQVAKYDIKIVEVPSDIKGLISDYNESDDIDEIHELEKQLDAYFKQI